MSNFIAPWRNNIQYETERELAERLGISYRTLQQKRSRGGGPPYVKFGHTVRYITVEVDEWLANHRRINTKSGGDV